MRKLALVMLLLGTLTGCQGIHEIRDQEGQKHTIEVSEYTSKVMKATPSKRQVLEKGFEPYSWEKYSEGRLEARVNIDEDSMKANMGIWRNEVRVEIRLDETERGQEILGVAAEIVGTELYDLVNEGRMYPEENYMIERIIGEYGVVYAKEAYGAEQVILIPTQSTYLDEEKAQEIEMFCGDQMVVTTVTAGPEKSMVELSFPSYQVRYHTIYLNNTTAYYQVFSDQNLEVEKIRMVINKYSDNAEKGVLDPDKLLPLRRMLQTKGVTTSGEMKVIADLEKVLEGKYKNCKGEIDGMNYKVSQVGNATYFEEVITLEMEF